MTGDPAPTLRIVAWEVTRRCPLNCAHCRGAARDEDYAGEHSTGEGMRLIDGIASFASPILILTGGEPMSRGDVYDLARHATGRGLRVAMSPCGAMINPGTARQIKGAAIQRISISLDGATAETHDASRGVPGAFNAAFAGIGHARDAGIEFQINTTVTRRNLAELPAILDLAMELGAAAFDVFMLVPVGRGVALKDEAISAEDYERTLNWIYDKNREQSIPIKPTCAPHYYRVLRQRETAAGRTVTPQSHGRLATTRGCLGGQGFVFVSHRGVLQICGFLDVPCGDVREAGFDFRKLYETSPVFREVRAAAAYHGKCGVCEYHNVCGGCRARAHALSGDYLGDEPFCVHVPEALREGDADG
ncbi:MAG: radical SAM protein [Planctomycetota bacterium]